MKKFIFSVLFFAVASTVNAQVVISQVYGGGGNSGATYTHDFIELFNPTASPINLSGWSVQYASSTGTSWSKTDLSGSIPAYGYYLVQQAKGSAGTTNLPTPDATGTTAMSATAGKVALVNNNIALTGTCPITSEVIDFVGFGSANCSNGSGPVATLSNTTAAIRKNNGCINTDNNAADFATGAPVPRNSSSPQNACAAPACTPPTNQPTLLQLSANGTSISGSFTAAAGGTVPAGGYLVLASTAATLSQQPVNGAAYTQNAVLGNATVIAAGNTTSFTANGLLATTNYHFFIYSYTNGLCYNLLNPLTGTITTAAQVVSAPILFDFGNCSNLLSDGFSKANITGNQQWGCTTYGNNGNGVQINGFVNGAQTNDAWLISPAISLSGITNIPVLSFYSRGDFNGPKLQVYVSTTYAGTGIPDPTGWTEITNANIANPSGNNSGSWNLSDNIDLSAYKTAEKIYIAFRYTSSPALNAARWSVDDVAITDRPVLVHATPGTINFGEIAAGQHSAGVMINLRAVTGSAINITAPAGYELSLDNTSFNPAPLTIDEATAVSGLNLYVRFSPQVKALKLNGNIHLTSGDFAKNIVEVTGSSLLKSETFDVGTYNLSFFGAGSTNSFTEQQRATQVANVTKVFEKLNLDVIGVEEVSHDGAFNQLVSNLPGYAGVLSHRWSYSFDAPDPTFPPQKIGFVYNAQTMTLSASEPPRAMFESLYDSARLGLTGHRLQDYPNGTPSSFWGSGRLPYLATFISNINGVNKKIRVIVIHAKSGSSAGDFNRRLYDVKVLKDSIDAMYANDNVILLGDYNDRLIKSIYTNSPTSSYRDYVNDVSNYSLPTYPLDEAGRTSFPSSSGLIDHIAISNELVEEYIAHSTDIEDPRTYLPSYTSTTGSDHLPVYSRFQLKACTFTVSIPDLPAITGGKINTLYKGYGPATATLNGMVSGDTAPYTYSWASGTAVLPVLSLDKTIEISPAASTTYVLTVHDKNGCYVPAVSKTISVVDVRCGNNMDKIMICHTNKNKQMVICVDKTGAEDHINKGATLGACPVSPVVTQAVSGSITEPMSITFSVTPNPATTAFNIRVSSARAAEPVQIRVFDMMGRVVETINNVAAGSILQMGQNYVPGIYLIELVQGNKRKQEKVIKQ